MHDDACLSPPRAGDDPAERLRAIVDRMQMAARGSAELDALLDAALAEAPIGAADAGATALHRRWSTDVGDALALLPPDFNFSLGQRDGVSWAWIQPNDRWEPAPYEARHDHPGGSGLVVANSPALALAAAAIILHIRGLEGSLSAPAPRDAGARPLAMPAP